MRRLAKTTMTLLCGLTSISAYYWYYRSNSSGFQYTRIAQLTYQIPDGELLGGFQSFPFSATLLATLSTILDLPVVDVNYLPLIFIAAVPSAYLVTRQFFDRKLAVLIMFTIVIFSFSRRLHYTQYPLAMAIYLGFVWAFYRYVTTGQKRFAVVTGSLFLAVFLFGPPMGAWVVGLLFTILIGLVLLQKYFIFNDDTWYQRLTIPTGLVFSGILVFVWFNRKLWEQLPERLLAVSLFRSDSVRESSELAASIASPPLIRWINISWFLMATVPVVIGVSWLTYKEGINPLKRAKEELYLLAVLAGAGIEFVVYFLVRGLTLRSVMLLSPLAAGYYVYRLVPRRVAVTFAVVFLSLSLAFAGMTIAVDMDRPANDVTASESAANFIFESELEVTTDHYTMGELRLGLAKQGDAPRDPLLSHYNEEKARFVLGGDQPPEDIPRLLVINKETLDFPLYTGDDWFEYQPIGESYSELHKHNDANKVYSSNSYDVFEINVPSDDTNRNSN